MLPLVHSFAACVKNQISLENKYWRVKLDDDIVVISEHTRELRCDFVPFLFILIKKSHTALTKKKCSSSSDLVDWFERCWKFVPFTWCVQSFFSREFRWFQLKGLLRVREASRPKFAELRTIKITLFSSIHIPFYQLLDCNFIQIAFTFTLHHKSTCMCMTYVWTRENSKLPAPISPCIEENMKNNENECCWCAARKQRNRTHQNDR